MKISILVLFLGVSQSIAAAIIDDSTAKVKVSMDIEGRGNLFSGVFEQVALNSAVHFDAEVKRLSFNTFGSYRYNRTANHVIENDFISFSVISLESRKGHFFSQAYYYFENSRLFRIKSRNVGVLGIGTELFRKKKNHKIIPSIGIGYENALFNGELFVNSNTVSNRRDGFLAAFRVVHQHRIMDGKVSISNLLLFRQSLESFEDFFLLVRPKFNYHLSKLLSVGVGCNLKYENVYLANLKRLNAAFFVGFEVNLKTKKQS